MSRPVRFGIVGCGVIAATHADAIDQLADAELSACCDIVPERAYAFSNRFGVPTEKRYADLPSFLADPDIDAVSICTPSGTHAGIAAQCLWSGKPVIIEKPVDVNLDAIALLCAAQRDTSLPVAVISQHRFDAATVYAHRLITEGYLGKLTLCEAKVKWYRSQEYYDSDSWRGTWELDGGGALMNQGVHTVDLMRWIMGPVHSIYAQARTLAHERIEVEDTLCATVSFANGAVGSLIATTSAYPGFPAELSFHGSEGSIVITGDALSVVDLARPGPTGEDAAALLAHGTAGHAVQIAQGGTRKAEANKPLMPTGAASSWGDAHRAQFSDFVDCIHSGRTPVVDCNAGKDSVEIVLAAYESARTGKTVLVQ